MDVNYFTTIFVQFNNYISIIKSINVESCDTLLQRERSETENLFIFSDEQKSTLTYIYTARYPFNIYLEMQEL